MTNATKKTQPGTQRKIEVSDTVVREIVRLARHPDSCPQSVPGAASMSRAYPCTCAIGLIVAALEEK